MGRGEGKEKEEEEEEEEDEERRRRHDLINDQQSRLCLFRLARLDVADVLALSGRVSIE